MFGVVAMFAISGVLLGGHTIDNHLHEKHNIKREPIKVLTVEKKEEFTVFGCKLEKVKPRD